MIKTLINGLIAIVIGVSLIPAVTASVDDAGTITTNETFTAVEDDTTEETVTVDNEILSISSVQVEGETVDESEYSYDGSDVTLDASTSTTDDEIEVFYSFEKELQPAVQTLVDLLPVLFVVVLVAGAVAYVRFRE